MYRWTPSYPVYRSNLALEPLWPYKWRKTAHNLSPAPATEANDVKEKQPPPSAAETNTREKKQPAPSPREQELTNYKQLNQENETTESHATNKGPIQWRFPG